MYAFCGYQPIHREALCPCLYNVRQVSFLCKNIKGKPYNLILMPHQYVQQYIQQYFILQTCVDSYVVGRIFTLFGVYEHPYVVEN